MTRSAEDNRSLAARLSAEGIEVVEVPLIEVTAPIDGGVAMEAAVDDLAAYRWVVLTSVNGVRATAAAMAGRHWPPGVEVVPVGPTTEAAARREGMPTVPAPPVATATELVARFPSPEQPGQRVLAALAELASDTVETGLAAVGYQIDRVTAYRTVAPATVALPPQAATADTVAFFSPSAVSRFVDRFGADAVPAHIVCVGPSTAARAAELNLTGVRTANPHTEDGVVAQLLSLVRSLPEPGQDGQGRRDGHGDDTDDGQ